MGLVQGNSVKRQRFRLSVSRRREFSCEGTKREDGSEKNKSWMGNEKAALILSDSLLLNYKIKGLLKPNPNPQQQLRDWQRRFRQECRNIERQIRDIQIEKKNFQKSIEDSAKGLDMGSAKALAKEILMSRKAVNRLYENKAQLNSISMHLGESVAIAHTVGHLSKSAEVMKLENNLMKAPEVAVTMQEFSKEMTKAGIIEVTVNDAVDTALDSDDIEEEFEDVVDKFLTEIAGETASQLCSQKRQGKKN